MAWQRFRVELVDRDAVEVQTSARDWSNVVVDPNAPKAIDLTFRVVHAALVRTGADVPRGYDAFLDVLDGIPTDIDGDDGDADPMDPTNGTP